MGHTHDNELANDGHIIYAATRSTGQIEEGRPTFRLQLWTMELSVGSSNRLESGPS
jgi:hypothetical protein